MDDVTKRTRRPPANRVPSKKHKITAPRPRKKKPAPKLDANQIAFRVLEQATIKESDG
jgi:hypothetical protein